MATHFRQKHGIEVRTEFGHSGKMRERIEAGDAVDVFTSADIGHPRKLVADGRASVMALFARNALCLLVPARFGPVGTANALEAMLRDGVRIGVAPPRSDPLGDYTVRLFERAESVRPGSTATLQARAVVLGGDTSVQPPARSGDLYVDALIAGQVDVVIVYCSGASRYEQANAKIPEVGTKLVGFPQSLTVGPEYGVALLKDAPPAAMMLMLTILSPEGQAILARRNFTPIGIPTGD